MKQILLLIFVIALAAPLSASAAYYVSGSINSAYVELYGVTGVAGYECEKLAQPFTPTSSITMTGGTIYGGTDSGSAQSDSAWTSIQTDSTSCSGGAPHCPSGVVLASSTLGNGSGWPQQPSNTGINFTFNNTVSLSASTMYWHVLDRTGTYQGRTNDYSVAGYGTNGSGSFGDAECFQSSGNWVTSSTTGGGIFWSQLNFTNNTPGLTIDNSGGTTFSGQTSFNYSYTVNSNTNGVLVVGVGTTNTGTGPTGVTYNSVAMTKATSTSNSTHGSSIWYLANPSTGANNITVSFSGSTNGAVGAVSFTGANTSNPLDTSATTNTTTGSSPTNAIVTMTPSQAGDYFLNVMAYSNRLGSLFTYNSETTVLYPSPANNIVSMGYLSVPNGMATTTGWYDSTNALNTIALSALAIQPVGSGASPSIPLPQPRVVSWDW